MGNSVQKTPVQTVWQLNLQKNVDLEARVKID